MTKQQILETSDICLKWFMATPVLDDVIEHGHILH